MTEMTEQRIDRDRIDRLETRLTFQDETIETLNQTITAQWHQIDVLTRQLAASASACRKPRPTRRRRPTSRRRIIAGQELRGGFRRSAQSPSSRTRAARASGRQAA